jgi:hypothetical protein
MPSAEWRMASGDELATVCRKMDDELKELGL